jgi:hypothetical protein
MKLFSLLSFRSDAITVILFHPKHAQWVKDRMKLLAMVTNQPFAISDSHALLTQRVVALLKCDVVGLSLDERNDKRLNNFIPIA